MVRPSETAIIRQNATQPGPHHGQHLVLFALVEDLVRQAWPGLGLHAVGRGEACKGGRTCRVHAAVFAAPHDQRGDGPLRRAGAHGLACGFEPQRQPAADAVVHQRVGHIGLHGGRVVADPLGLEPIGHGHIRRQASHRGQQQLLDRVEWQRQRGRRQHQRLDRATPGGVFLRRGQGRDEAPGDGTTQAVTHQQQRLAGIGLPHGVDHAGQVVQQVVVLRQLAAGAGRAAVAAVVVAITDCP